MNKVVIVGAGASGLISAIYAKKNNHDVIILEKNNECGKKILVTGNGRCNYFNEDQDLKHYYSSSGNINEIITKDNINEILNFFNSIGIVPKIKNGYYYPYSNQASSIKRALEYEIKRLNIKVITDFDVKKIIKENDKFIIYSENDNITCDKVVLATGSKSYPKTGSTGDGYKIAKSFGHNIVKVLPSLTQLKCHGNYFKKLSGIRCEVNLKLYEDNKFIKEENGELQLTNYGISGICTFNLSGIVSRGLNSNKKEDIVINFLPFINANKVEDVIKFIDDRNSKILNRNIGELFEGLLNNKLIDTLIEISNINKTKSWNQLSNEEKTTLANNICFFKVNVFETNSFDSAQVCTGGINLKEVDLNNMQSKLIDGLYFSGEILDVDGDCGGYNLTFAWISGMISGKNI